MATKKTTEKHVLRAENVTDQVQGGTFVGGAMAEDPRGDLEKRARGTDTTLDVVEGMQSKTRRKRSRP